MLPQGFLKYRAWGGRGQIRSAVGGKGGGGGLTILISRGTMTVVVSRGLSGRKHEGLDSAARAIMMDETPGSKKKSSVSNDG